MKNLEILFGAEKSISPVLPSRYHPVALQLVYSMLKEVCVYVCVVYVYFVCV